MLFACPATDDFFRSRIDHMIDLRHPLVVLASRMPWQEIEAWVAQVFSRKGRAGVSMPDLDLFGKQVQRVAVCPQQCLRHIDATTQAHREGFGWAKTIGQIRQVMGRGLKNVDQIFVLNMAAYNLVRMRSLGHVGLQGTR